MSTGREGDCSWCTRESQAGGCRVGCASRQKYEALRGVFAPGRKAAGGRVFMANDKHFPPSIVRMNSYIFVRPQAKTYRESQRADTPGIRAFGTPDIVVEPFLLRRSGEQHLTRFELGSSTGPQSTVVFGSLPSRDFGNPATLHFPVPSLSLSMPLSHHRKDQLAVRIFAEA